MTKDFSSQPKFGFQENRIEIWKRKLELYSRIQEKEINLSPYIFTSFLNPKRKHIHDLKRDMSHLLIQNLLKKF